MVPFLSRRFAEAFVFVAVATLAFAPVAGAASGSITRWSVMAGELEDRVSDCVSAPDGSVYSVGRTYSQGQGSNALVMRNSSSGTLSWYREWDNPSAHLLDEAVALAVDRASNVIVAGASAGVTEGDNDVLVLKYDKGGRLKWQRVIDGGENGDDEATDVVVDSIGDVYVTGSRHRAATGYDFWTLKLSGVDGSTIWENVYDGLGRGDVPGALCIDGARNVYVTGESGALPYSSDIATIRIGPDGTTAWAQRTSGPTPVHDDWGGHIALGRSGALFVAATAPGEDDQAFMVLRLTTAGALVWRRTYDDSAGWHDVAEGLRVDRSNNVWVVGTMTSRNRASSKGLVAKWNPSGKRLWVRQWGSPGGRPAEFRALTIDSKGTAWCAGYMKSSTGDLEGLVVKYASSGSGIWSKGWEGPGRRDDVFDCIALNGTSGLFAGGHSVGRTSGLDAAVVRYVR